MASWEEFEASLDSQLEQNLSPGTPIIGAVHMRRGQLATLYPEFASKLNKPEQACLY